MSNILQNIQKLSNILLLFAIILDPTNTIFGIKDIAFAIFVISNLPNINFKNIFFFLIFMFVFFVSLSFGLLSNQMIDLNASIGILKSFVFLFYIFFIPAKHLNFFKYFYHICLLMAIVEILIYLIMCFVPAFSSSLYSYMVNHDNTAMINLNRNFYGITIASVFYKTSPMLVITECFALTIFFKKGEKKYLLHALLSISGLLCSGTRANMLSCVLVGLIIFLSYNFYVKKRMLSSIFIFSIVGFCTIFLIIFLLTTSESSTDIKTEHLKSFFVLFFENPLIYGTIGSGAGTIMYTSGFNQHTTVTELSYLELIKNFGLIGTVFILILLFIPFIYLFKNNKYKILDKISFSIGYLAYLFIAGTNPLLIGSTGFTVIAIIYYLSSYNVYDEMSKQKKRKKSLLKMRYL